MNTSDIVAELSEQTGMSRSSSKAAVDAVFDAISKALADGQEVRLGDVGKLAVKVRASREINGFGKKQVVPERRVVKFKAFAGMSERLNPPKGRRRATA